MITLRISKILQTTEGKLPLDVDLLIEKNQFVALYGKSGVGKTTLLRILAGLSSPDEGLIQVGDQCWFDSKKKISLKPRQRKVGFVFQDYSLFPHMSVRKNIEFALPKNGEVKSVDDIISAVGLSELQHRLPEGLSGGQQQRVAVARAVAYNPEILLLDEPFSALDAEMRNRLQEEISAIHQQFNMTTILVSHDTAEVFKLADRVYVIDQGKIIRKGTPMEVFVDENIEGSVKLPGTVVEIRKEAGGQLVRVMAANNLIEVMVSNEAGESLNPGDRVVVATDLDSPAISKLNPGR